MTEPSQTETEQTVKPRTVNWERYQSRYKITPELIAEMKALYMSGLNSKEIGAKFDIHRSAVIYQMHKGKWRKEFTDKGLPFPKEPQLEIHRITEDQIKQIIEMYIAGYTHTNIKMTVGCDYKTISAYIKKYNLRPLRKRQAAVNKIKAGGIISELELAKRKVRGLEFMAELFIDRCYKQMKKVLNDFDEKMDMTLPENINTFNNIVNTFSKMYGVIRKIREDIQKDYPNENLGKVHVTPGGLDKHCPPGEVGEFGPNAPAPIRKIFNESQPEP